MLYQKQDSHNGHRGKRFVQRRVCRRVSGRSAILDRRPTTMAGTCLVFVTIVKSARTLDVRSNPADRSTHQPTPRGGPTTSPTLIGRLEFSSAIFARSATSALKRRRKCAHPKRRHRPFRRPAAFGAACAIDALKCRPARGQQWCSRAKMRPSPRFKPTLGKTGTMLACSVPEHFRR